MKTIMYIMANDAKWVQQELDLPFTPYPGMDFEGLAGEQPLKISGMSYNVKGSYYKLRLAWLSQDPLDSKQMLEYGWELAKK